MTGRDDDSWLARAACAGDDLDQFFSNPVAALRICSGCEVRPECLYGALTVELPGARYGVRGGLTAKQRSDVPPLSGRRSEDLATLREYLTSIAPSSPQPEGTPHAVNNSPAIPPAPSAGTEQLSVSQLLKWGCEHADSDIREQAERARTDLAGLRKRHAADQELTAISTEAQNLEKRLAELRAREAELTPPKQKKSRSRNPVDYPAAEIRTWAKTAGVHCPPVGRVPKPVVDAWRAATRQETDGADA
ncbi:MULTISPECIES: WhiB family transcriptional regulator [unclassified Streptomyces]|uniref:WhiB family transcriptional regulator n=1 Tax=unclassified Streptomyces TaxID=2593676 RepID=UPI0013E8D24C|nr:MULTISPECIES: WhiB family transcriptional regulator [unclassified Streptomyces]